MTIACNKEKDLRVANNALPGENGRLLRVTACLTAPTNFMSLRLGSTQRI